MSIKSKEYYLNQYREKVKKLTSQGNAWRIRYDHEDEFVNALDAVFNSYENKTYINDFHRENSFKVGLELLFQTKKTLAEMKEQGSRLKRAAEEEFKKEIPQVKEQLAKIKCPISLIDQSNIYRWIYRNQIQLDDIPMSALNEFKLSKQYKDLVDRKLV